MFHRYDVHVYVCSQAKKEDEHLFWFKFVVTIRFIFDGHIRSESGLLIDKNQRITILSRGRSEFHLFFLSLCVYFIQ